MDGAAAAGARGRSPGARAGTDPVLTLRPMALADLELFAAWLREPHFARWFLQDATVEEELADNRSAIVGDEPVTVVIAELDGRAVGWGQWYRWESWPAEAAKYEALPGEVGIDYGIGDPACVGRGIGTRLVAELVRSARRSHPRASVLVGPSAANRASCAVLEKNGFSLVDVRDIAGEPNASPLALYRLVGDLGGA